MTAVALAPAQGVPGSELAGTRGLVRLALRADRVRIVVWAAAVAYSTLASVQAYERLFPDTAARQARAELMSSPAATALAGPGFGLDDYTIGAMVANELYLWLLIPVAIMAVLAVTRHLRAPEEDGRLELVRSAPVGRDAPIVAGLVAATVSVVAVGAATFALLLTTDLDPAGSALLCCGLVVVGLVFAGTSAVASQVSSTARSASAIGMAALGLAVVLRGIGDVQGPRSTSAWSWLSPLGWAQATAPYTLDRWWPLLVAVAAVAVTVGLAFALVGRRDLGTGLVAERLGRERGSISGVVGLTWRRQRTSILAWSIAIVLTGAFIGVLAQSLVDFIDTESTDVQQLFPTGEHGAVASVFSVYVVFLAVMAGAYAATAMGAARAEEVDGRAAAVLAGPVPRWRWLGAQVALAGGVAAVTMLVTGLLMGFAGARSLDDPGQLGDLLGAAAVTLPGVLVVLGVAVLLVGLAPRAFAVVWAYVAYVALIGVFGAILPDGADALSPFAYLPALPAESMSWGPVVLVTIVGAALVVAGLAAFRRRDSTA